MAEQPVIPYVTFRLYHGNELGLYRGYLIQTPDGSYWAIPEDAARDHNVNLATAYRLDPSQLEEQPKTHDGKPLYLYRAVLNAPQQETQTRPSIEGRYQGR